MNMPATIPTPPGHKQRRSKVTTTLTIQADLLATAKSLGINLSATLEESLQLAIRAKRMQQWQQETQKDIELYNQRVIEDGCFGDAFRNY